MTPFEKFLVRACERGAKDVDITLHGVRDGKLHLTVATLSERETFAISLPNLLPRPMLRQPDVLM